MLQRLFSGFTNQRNADKRAHQYRELIRKEAQIGGQLFGPVQPGGRREFFCLNRTTWIWHEEWTDEQNQHHSMTTRYDVRPNGIMKAQDGHPYHYISQAEAKHFLQAVKIYNERVQNELYSSVAHYS